MNELHLPVSRRNIEERNASRQASSVSKILREACGRNSKLRVIEDTAIATLASRDQLKERLLERWIANNSVGFPGQSVCESYGMRRNVSSFGAMTSMQLA